MDRENIKEKLRENPNITMREWNRKFSPPRSETIANKFGSWLKAKREVGISEEDSKDYPKKWSKEEIIGILRDHPDITMREWDSEISPPNSTTVIDRFGSWNESKREAGLSESHIFKKGPKDWTREEIKEVLREHPNLSSWEWEREKMVPALSTIRDRFGSWSNAREEAGLEVQSDSSSQKESTFTGKIKDIFE